MGTNYKRAVLEEHTANVIKQWHATVKQKRKKQKDYSESAHDNSTKTWDSNRTSPHHLYSHPPSPTFTTTPAVASEIEISPDHQQEIVVVQDGHTLSDHTVSSVAVQIEMPNVSVTRT